MRNFTRRANATNKPMQCTFSGCGKWLASKQSLKQHMFLHTDERPYVCGHPGCPYRTRNTANLKSHKLLHLDPSERPRFYCTQPGCIRSFMQRSSLRDHLKIHKDRRSYVCDYPGCGRRFLGRTHLKDHSLVHLSPSERPQFPCLHPGCGKVLLSERSLRNHTASHAVDRPYVCTYPGCTYKSALSAALRSHIRTHFGILQQRKRQFCRCGRSFYYRRDLLRHMRRFHETRDLNKPTSARHKVTHSLPDAVPSNTLASKVDNLPNVEPILEVYLSSLDPIALRPVEDIKKECP